MLILTDIAIGFICPYCGSEIFQTFSLFELRQAAPLQLRCGCEALVCLISREYDDLISVQLWGECCEEPHEFCFAPSELVEDNLLGLGCDASGMGLGFIGDPRVVKLAMEECILPTEI